jgi:hypothetical protein
MAPIFWVTTRLTKASATSDAGTAPRIASTAIHAPLNPAWLASRPKARTAALTRAINPT